MTKYWKMQNHSYRLCKNTLTTVDVHNISTQHLLQDINLDVETYIDVLNISERGPNVILQQNPQDVF